MILLWLKYMMNILLVKIFPYHVSITNTLKGKPSSELSHACFRYEVKHSECNLVIFEDTLINNHINRALYETISLLLLLIFKN